MNVNTDKDIDIRVGTSVNIHKLYINLKKYNKFHSSFNQLHIMFLQISEPVKVERLENITFISIKRGSLIITFPIHSQCKFNQH